MNKLERKRAKEILDLNPNGFIDEDIAKHQFETILRGFNYLNQKGNKYLYIADEVGLGKTYIALGIASLLRYFATDTQVKKYRDLIIVPKKNLQDKWRKEIQNFTTRNFKKNNNRVKNILGDSIATSKIYDRLSPFSNDHPEYSIFRFTSFSIPLSRKNWEGRLYDDNIAKITFLDSDEKKSIKKAFKKFKAHKDGKQLVKRLYAYVLNLSFKKTDLLIIDEAHNLRHGIGEDVSDRNNVMSRLMGKIYNKEDEEIFNKVPWLKKKVKPISNKYILLSATPLNKGCYEIKNQLDVILPKHKYSKYNIEKSNTEVKNDLSQFMMRGLMNVSLGVGESRIKYSRNQYRYEHRHGNTNKSIEPDIQSIAKINKEDPFLGALLGILQLKIAESLKKNHGGAFEMGMLSSFETFNTPNTNENEYEVDNSQGYKKDKVDTNFIQNMVHSYKNEFNEDLKHPKQEDLIERIFEKMKRQEKSLIFVRRIATVEELTRKLTHKYEEDIFERIKDLKIESDDINILIKAYADKDIEEKRSEFIYRIAIKIAHAYEQFHLIHKEIIEKNDSEDEDIYYIEQCIKEIITRYREVERNNEDVERLNKFLSEKTHLINIPREVQDSIISILQDKMLNAVLFKDYEVGNSDENTDARSRYFFLNYFTETYPLGKKFRNYITRQNWYKYNIYFLLKKKGSEGLGKIVVENSILTAKTNAQKLDEINKILEENISKDISLEHVDEDFKVETFLNKLLDGELSAEWNHWLSERKDLGYTELLRQVDSLVKIIQGVFRHGSGLLPSYMAYLKDKDNFETTFIEILKSTFPEVLAEVKTILIDFQKIMFTNFPDQSKISTSLYSQEPVLPASGTYTSSGWISRLALQFRMPGFPFVVITTDVLKEGEDLHTYCSDVYHYGIAWNPSDMEQRTGRIDRINSKTYGHLKKDNAITFDNSLHVFYPYLQDTLEVYQMQRLFTNMNKFVETFHDISEVTAIESKVSIDDFIHEMPKQIEGKQASKFNYNNFKIENYDDKDLLVPKHIGQSIDDLLPKLRTLYTEIKQLKHFKNLEPIKSESDFSIAGKLEVLTDIQNVENESLHIARRGPYEIHVIPSSKFGYFEYKIYGGITFLNRLDKNKIKIIEDDLTENGYEWVIRNQKLFATIKTELSESRIIEILKKLVSYADTIEFKQTARDYQ